MLPALAAMPGFLLWRARLRAAAVLAETLPPGVEAHGFSTLAAVGDRPRSQQELARITATSRTTVSAAAADLVERGLVERVRDPADRRSYALTRTDAGRRAVDAWRDHVHRVGQGLLAGLDAGERAELARLLRAVTVPLLDEDTPTELTDVAGFLVTRLHERMYRDFRTALVPVGVEPPHVGALVAIGAAAPLTQVRLAEHLGVSPGRLVRVVDELEERGLVERRPAPGDRRTRLLHLREAGVAALGPVREASAATMDALLSPLTTDERERFRRLLVAVVEHPAGPA